MKRQSKILSLLFFILCFIFQANAQQNIQQIDSLPTKLDGLWKFNTRDDIRFASPAYNDSAWTQQKSRLNYGVLDSIGFKGFAWFRLRIRLPYAADSIIYALQLTQTGASEVYVDGKKIVSYGKVFRDGKNEERFDPKSITEPLLFKADSVHLIAIRYSNHKYEEFTNWDSYDAGFTCWLAKYGKQNLSTYTEQVIVGLFLLVIAGIFLALAMIHFLFFVFYRKQKQHFYYGILAIVFSLFFIGGYTSTYTFIPDIYLPIRFFNPIALPFYFISLMGFIYYLVLNRLPKLFWLQVAIGVCIVIGFFFKTGLNVLFHIALVIFVTIEAIRILIKGIRQKKKGIKIIAGGFALFLALCVFIIILFFWAVAMNGDVDINFSNDVWIIFALVVTVLSIPVSISIYLARNFATLNIDLQKKLEEVEHLSEQMLQQEKEKKKILRDQNIVLEQQVAERTLELSQKNKDITDSINYAQRIQRALLAGEEMLSTHFREHFVFFQPKDIVSGDFYWATVLDNGQIALVTADSTGHGVPGAIMSMLNIACLTDAVEARKLTDPGQILDYTRSRIIRQLAKDGSAEGGKDGMDCSILCFELTTNIISYAAANNPVWIARKTGDSMELIELDPDKMPVGRHDRQNESFTSRVINVQKDDVIYTLTDGMPDQFGGPKGKKMMYKRLKELLLSLSQLPMKEQQEKLKTAFNDWKKGYEQVDDVCLIGVRI
jgi:serine phosphatase RsbU (regulator of sigma subunit)